MEIIKDGKTFTIRLVSTDERGLEVDEGEPQYVTAFHYDIVAFEIDSDDVCNEVGRQVVGEINAYYLDGSGAYEPSSYGMSPNALVEEADDIDQDVFSIAQALYANQDTLFNLGAATLDTFYIDYVEVKEGWRGYDVGLLAAETVIRSHGPNANIALIPKQGEGASKLKLTRYLKRLGLKKLPVKNSFLQALWHNASMNRKRFTAKKAA
jgi:hypothetical protein